MAAKVTYQLKVKGPSASQIGSSFDAAYAEGMRNFKTEITRIWNEKAAASLDTTTQAYMSGLSVQVVSDGVEATLSGWLPVALETGAQRFDMKPGLLRDRQSRVIKMHDGEFRTVSQMSPAHSWWHPGFKPKSIHEEVFAETEAAAEKAFTAAFDRIKV